MDIQYRDNMVDHLHGLSLDEATKKSREALEAALEGAVKKVTVYAEPHAFDGAGRTCRICGHKRNNHRHTGAP